MQSFGFSPRTTYRGRKPTVPEEAFGTDEGQRMFNRLFAGMMFDDDVRYVLVCHDCNTAIGRRQNSAVVKRARDDDRTQPCTCGGEYLVVRDNRPD